MKNYPHQCPIKKLSPKWDIGIKKQLQAQPVSAKGNEVYYYLPNFVDLP